MFLTIKKIPKVSWSSEKPLNFKPKLTTFLFLCFGLSLFGIGEGLLLASYTGASPWSVLAQGISLNIDYSVSAGSVVLIPDGWVHKVWNTSEIEDLIFVCVFEGKRNH